MSLDKGMIGVTKFENLYNSQVWVIKFFIVQLLTNEEIIFTQGFEAKWKCKEGIHGSNFDMALC